MLAAHQSITVMRRLARARCQSLLLSPVPRSLQASDHKSQYWRCDAHFGCPICPQPMAARWAPSLDKESRGERRKLHLPPSFPLLSSSSLSPPPSVCSPADASSLVLRRVTSVPSPSKRSPPHTHVDGDLCIYLPSSTCRATDPVAYALISTSPSG